MKLLELMRGTNSRARRAAAFDALDEVEELAAQALRTAERIAAPPHEPEDP